ncbi:hypothetical protein RJ640_014582 [Escallonia rubra]|uniref:Uncharacterized protein n=1 Tax=Escallonia rubra TaxID=112253 RepID=A0AA88UDA3_9ASTE|nr:hypothetical protein RJ640_014582 [Escallonia rubra]
MMTNAKGKQSMSSPTLPPPQARAKQLHNFDLPQLWAKNQTHASNNSLRGRRIGGESSASSSSSSRNAVAGVAACEAPSPPPPPPPPPSPPPSPSSDLARLRKLALETAKRNELALEAARKNAAAADKPDKKVSLDVFESKEAKPKTYIRLRVKKKAEEQQAVKEDGKVEANEGCGEMDEFIAKTWNFRPRKPINKQAGTNVSNAGALKAVESTPKSKGKGKGTAASEKGKEKKPPQPKFSISLTRQEIEEDIFSLTGSKPSRRPKKRSKAVQKQLDNLFPGVWLEPATHDLYKVPDPPLKV